MAMPGVSGTCFPEGFRVKCAFGDCLLCVCVGRQQEMCVSPCWWLAFGTMCPEEGKVRT